MMLNVVIINVMCLTYAVGYPAKYHSVEMYLHTQLQLILNENLNVWVRGSVREHTYLPCQKNSCNVLCYCLQQVAEVG